jgi:hypothetical protein
MVDIAGIRRIVYGEEPSPNGDYTLDLVDWCDLFAGITHEDPIIEGVAYRGRWTAYAAPGKAGKSTYTIHLALEVQAGRDPFDGTPQTPIPVIYIDGEMGRVDMHERLDELDLTPAHLAGLHYTDLVPKLDTVAGAARLLNAVKELRAGLVIIDGINGCVTGAEKDDTPWRDFYDNTIAPLKRMGVAVITNDNLGKDKTLGPRGSSVKVDKPDAVIQLHRTDNGIKLAATHRRTAAYPLELNLVIVGTDGNQPIGYRRVAGSWPAGTAVKAAELDALGIPVNASQRAARQALKDAGIAIGRSETLAAAMRYRRSAEHRDPVDKYLISDGITPGIIQKLSEGITPGDRSTQTCPEQGGALRGSPGITNPGGGDHGGVSRKGSPPDPTPPLPDPDEEF